MSAQILKPDTSVYDIKLDDYPSTERKLGKNIVKKRFEERGSFPRIEIVNKTRTQILRLYFHYGGVLNSVDQFELIKIDNNYKLPEQIVYRNDLEFPTSRGIRLGINKSELIKLLGRNYKQVSKHRLTYAIATPAIFPVRYNRYSYFINCDFKNDKLIRYSFGFDYE